MSAISAEAVAAKTGAPVAQVEAALAQMTPDDQARVAAQLGLDLLQNCMNSSRKPGPRPSPVRAQLRAMFPEWSDRTFATYYRAAQQLGALDRLKGNTHDEETREVIALASRPNGTVNVSRLAWIAEARCALWVASLDDDDKAAG